MIRPEDKNLLNDILTFICDYMSINKEKLLKGKRTNEYVFAKAMFYQYVKDTTVISGANTMYFIGNSHGMQTHYKNLIRDDYILKPLYMKFRLFMEDKKDVSEVIKATFGYHEEAQAKLNMIYDLIKLRFKTERFRKQHLNKLRDVIWLMDKKNMQKSLLNLAGWFEDFSIEYFEDKAKELQDNFYMRGVSEHPNPNF